MQLRKILEITLSTFLQIPAKCKVLFFASARLCVCVCLRVCVCTSFLNINIWKFQCQGWAPSDIDCFQSKRVAFVWPFSFAHTYNQTWAKELEKERKRESKRVRERVQEIECKRERKEKERGRQTENRFLPIFRREMCDAILIWMIW